MTTIGRRAVLAGLAAAALPRPALAQGARGRVVVVGGGFGGASAARVLHRAGLAVTLIEPAETYYACPFSNEVIAGLRPLSAQAFGYEGLRASGVTVAKTSAEAIDGAARQVRLADGARLAQRLHQGVQREISRRERRGRVGKRPPARPRA